MSKKSRFTNEPAAPQPTGLSRRWLGRLLMAGLVGGAMASAGLCAAASFHWLRARVAALPDGQLDSREIRLSPPPPPWIRLDLKSHALAAAGLDGKPLPLTDPHLVERLERAFELSPWVARVSAHRAYRRLELRVTYRRPVLCVPWGTEGCYVAADGIVLPANTQADHDSLQACLVLEASDLQEEPLPPPGRPFLDSRVTAAARLANLIVPYKDRLGVVAIVAHSGRNAPLVCDLQTKDGGTISWGRVEENAPPSADTARLEQLLGYLTPRDPPHTVARTPSRANRSKQPSE